MNEDTGQFYPRIDFLIGEIEKLHAQATEELSSGFVGNLNSINDKVQSMSKDIDAMISEFDIDYAGPRFSIKGRRIKNKFVISSLMDCSIFEMENVMEIKYGGIDKPFVARIFDCPIQIDIWDTRSKELVLTLETGLIEPEEFIGIMEGQLKGDE